MLSKWINLLLVVGSGSVCRGCELEQVCWQIALFAFCVLGLLAVESSSWVTHIDYCSVWVNELFEMHLEITFIILNSLFLSV